MKVLAAGDIHGDIDLAKTLARQAEKEKVDLVILCGDLTQNETSTDNIVGQFKNKKVLLIPGNHESVATADFLAELYNAKNIHGYSIKCGDVGFFGCSAANMGLFKMEEKEILSMLKKGHKYIKNCTKKIMVTHTHPEGSLMERFSSFVPGSEGVRKAIDELHPDILFCSHVHEAEGVEEMIGKTRIINVSRRGKILEI